MLFNITKEQLQARFELVKAIRELIIREYADYKYEQDLKAYQEKLDDAVKYATMKVAEAERINSGVFTRILQTLGILATKSVSFDYYFNYKNPKPAVKEQYLEEFEKQAALAETGITIKATHSSPYITWTDCREFDSDVEFAFDFSIRHYEAIKSSASRANNEIKSTVCLSTFVNGNLSIDLPRNFEFLKGSENEFLKVTQNKEFLQRVKENVVPKLEEVDVDCFPFITSLELAGRVHADDQMRQSQTKSTIQTVWEC